MIRLVVALLRWPLRRWLPGVRGFAHHRGLRTLFTVLVAGVAVEGVVVDLLLGVILPRTPWPWIGIALHVVALVWVLGSYASVVTRPHIVTADGLRLAGSKASEVVVPHMAIRSVRAVPGSHFGSSGFIVEGRTATLADGDTTIVLTLEPDAILTVDGTPLDARITTLRLTVDDPDGFVAAVEGRVPA